MRIKLSKSQWEGICKAGSKIWIKKESQETSPAIKFEFDPYKGSVGITLDGKIVASFPSDQISDIIGQLKYIQYRLNQPK